MAVQVLAQWFLDLLSVQTQDTTRETLLCDVVAMRAPTETIRILIQCCPQVMWIGKFRRTSSSPIGHESPSTNVRASSLGLQTQHNSYYVNNNNNNTNRNQNYKEMIEFSEMFGMTIPEERSTAKNFAV